MYEVWIEWDDGELEQSRSFALTEGQARNIAARLAARGARNVLIHELRYDEEREMLFRVPLATCGKER